jgi:RHS repeat-associated protein
MTSFCDENGLVLEKYFIGLYEKEIEGAVTRHINYVMAGDGMTAIVIEEENGISTSETYYTYKDHLGSIVALTDVSGDVIMEQSFDACSVTLKLDDDNQSNFLVEPIPTAAQSCREGRYRNPNDWTYNNINESPTWLRGYTGHEFLPHFDLINMNGRIYDPILGRMLSPDRFVPDPLSTQGYNRYSYVFNNPLRYTDPSGDLPVAMAIGMVLGGYVGGAIQSGVYNPFTAQYWQDGWQGFVVGAVVGGTTGLNVGAKISAKTTAPTIGKSTIAATTTGVFSGVLNAFYSYDYSAGFGWRTLAQFGAGFIGGYTAVNLGLLSGMLVGGGTNVIAHLGDYEDGFIAYQVAQKFIGGALVAYGGYSLNKKIFNNRVRTDFQIIENEIMSNPYTKFSHKKFINESTKYGVFNVVTDFSYSDRDDFINREPQEYAGIFFSGFINGGIQYTAPFFSEAVNSNWAGFTLSMAGNIFDYNNVVTFQNNNFLYNNGFYGLPQKASIMTYKSFFYNFLTLW